MEQYEKNIAFYNTMKSLQTILFKLNYSILVDFNNTWFNQLFQDYKNGNFKTCKEKIRFLTNSINSIENNQNPRIYNELQSLLYMCQKETLNKDL